MWLRPLTKRKILIVTFDTSK